MPMYLWEEAPKTEFLGLQVYSFGLNCAFGSIAAAAVICILCRASGMKKGTGPQLSLLSILCGMIGARMLFCLLSIPGEGIPFTWWFNLSSGGFSMFGMILGAFSAAWICALIIGENAYKLLDTVSCAIPLAVAAERTGEQLFDGFDVSRTVKGVFPAGTFLAVENELYGTSSLATWLVSAILSIILFLILTFLLLRKERKDGEQWIIFLLLCGAGGMILESLRYDYHLEYSFVYYQQIISALFLLWGIIMAQHLYSRRGNRLFFAAAASFAVSIAVCGGAEFALDRMNVNHIAVYIIMTMAVAVPAILGILLVQGKGEKGKEAA